MRLTGYRAAFVHEDGLNRVPVDDPYRIARIPVGLSTDLERELSA